MKDPEIIFENSDFLVVNKPSGLVVHGDGRTEERTLSDWVLEEFPEMESVGEPWQKDDDTIIARPGVVHRLDRETSGVMVLAKNQVTFEYLKALFASRKVEKTYCAFVYGYFQDTSGVIEKEIGKSKRDFRKWSAEFGARGKMREAVTEWKMIEEGEVRGEKVSFLEVFPKTGRTHQIRVHLKAVGKPVLCDSLYAPNVPVSLGFQRLALHAQTLSFKDENGEKQRFEASLPLDFLEAKKLLSEAE